MSDLPLKIGEIEKNKTEQIRVAIQEFKGKILCDIRVFGMFSAAGGPMPTPKGISFSVSLIGALIEVLQDAQAKAKELGLMGGDA